MQTKIRLTRVGGKKDAKFRIVVSSVKSPRDGRFLAIIGNYDPAKGVKDAKIDKEKAAQWMKRGAQPSDVVRQILKYTQA